ncbi:MAG: helix-turn-helix transcriptional regulator [Coriobacteriia bacterium]
MARGLDTSMRARRLVALLPLLRRGDRVALSDLAAAVGCTAEEVAADLTTLTMCGIPPFTPFDLVDLDIDGDQVTVHADPPGLDQPLKLTAPEARALGAALEVAGYAPDAPLRAKLAAVTMAAASAEELERTIRTGTAPGGAAETYAALAAAAEAHEKLRIAYHTGSTGRVSERVIHPWAIVQRLGVWYLVAMCEAAGQERVFRMDRIRAFERTGDLFETPSGVPTAVVPDPGGLDVAEILFAPGSRLPDDRAWPGVRIEVLPDGSARAWMPYRTTAWVARRVIAHLGEATVVGPDEVRRAVRELAAATLQQVQ